MFYGDIDYRIQILNTLTEFMDIKLINLLSTLQIFHALRENIFYDHNKDNLRINR
jgi:hypothetical protein